MYFSKLYSFVLVLGNTINECCIKKAIHMTNIIKTCSDARSPNTKNDVKMCYDMTVRAKCIVLYNFQQWATIVKTCVNLMLLL